MSNQKNLVDFCVTYVRKHIFRFSIIAFLEIVASLSMPFVAYGMKKIIDDLGSVGKYFTFSDISNSFTVLFLALIISLVANRLSGFTNMFNMPVIRKEIRRDIFSYMLGHSHRYFLDNMVGSLGHRVSEMSRQFSLVISISIFAFLPTIVTMATTLTLIYQASNLFLSFLSVWITLYVILSFVVSSGLKKRSKEYAEKYSLTSGRIIDSVTNIFNIKSFASSDYEISNLDEILDEELIYQRRMFKFMEYNRLFQGVANLFLLSGLTYFAIYLLQKELITIGDLVLVYSLSFTIMNGLDKISINLLDVFEAIGSLRESIDKLMQPHEIIDARDAHDLKITEGKIEFRNISFSYNNKLTIFKDFNLTINKKEKIGLVGVSGGGKSTLVNLLLRMYELQNGSIMIDGTDIKLLN